VLDRVVAQHEQLATTLVLEGEEDLFETFDEIASSVRSQSLPPIPLVRTPASLGAIFGGQTGLFGGVAIARDGSISIQWL